MFTIDDYWLVFVVSTVLPALTALATKRFANPALQGAVLALLSAVTGTLASIQLAGGVFEWKTALSATFISFITGVVTHFGLLKPAGVTGEHGVIAKKVPGGVG